MAAILTGPGVGKDLSCEVGQAKGIIKLAKRGQTGIRRNLRAVELQLQAVIEGDPERATPSSPAAPSMSRSTDRDYAPGS